MKGTRSVSFYNLERESDCRLMMSLTTHLYALSCIPAIKHCARWGQQATFPTPKNLRASIVRRERGLLGRAEEHDGDKPLRCYALPCPALLSHIPSFPTASYPTISYPTTSYPIISYPILSYPTPPCRSLWCRLSLILFLCDAFTCPPPHHCSHPSRDHLPSAPIFLLPLNCGVRILVLSSSTYFLRHMIFTRIA